MQFLVRIERGLVDAGMSARWRVIVYQRPLVEGKYARSWAWSSYRTGWHVRLADAVAEFRR